MCKKMAVVAVCVLAVLFCSEFSKGEETARVVQARIVSADLFKNGIAVITKKFEAEAAGGEYLIVQPPPQGQGQGSGYGGYNTPDIIGEPLHGTFWVDSEAPARVRFSKSGIYVTVGKAARPNDIYISYLARGIFWAPAYKIDLGEGGLGSIAMQADIINKMDSLSETRVSLITGFPSIQFQNVTSPLSMATDMKRFFTELSIDPNSWAGKSSMAQQIISNAGGLDYGASGPQLPGMLGGDYDVTYRDVGVLSLDNGESMMLPIDKKEIKYEKIVQWTIPDNRDSYGRIIDSRSSYQDNAKAMLMDDVWDAVRFANPFDFPMTTAPISSYQKRRFIGQGISYWAAPGKSVVAQVTKALNIKVVHSESEVENSREEVQSSYPRTMKTKVKGSIKIHNNRDKKVRVLVRRQFSGKLIEAEGNPVLSLRPEGVWCLNERSQLEWEIELSPGQDVYMTYTYETLSYQ